MKKILRILIFIMLLFLLSFTQVAQNRVFADGEETEESKSVDDVLGEADAFLKLDQDNEVLDAKELSNLIYNVLLAIGMIAAVIVGIILGIKFMISSVEEKANVKKSLISYSVGCVVLFGAFGIWSTVMIATNEVSSMQDTLGEKYLPSILQGNEQSFQEYDYSLEDDFDYTKEDDDDSKDDDSGKDTNSKVGKYSVSSKTKPKSVSNWSSKGYPQTIKLGKRTFKLYKQYGAYYSGDAYNSTNNTHMQTISSTGCGPSSIAIVLSGYGYDYNPSQIGKKLLKNSIPSSLASMKKEINAIGRNVVVHNTYSSKNYTKVYNKIKNALSNDRQIVLWVGKTSSTTKETWGKFTDSGYHFISILGIDLSNDKVFVGNPGKSGGWLKLSEVVKARGSHVTSMRGWIEIY